MYIFFSLYYTLAHTVQKHFKGYEAIGVQPWKKRQDEALREYN